MKTGRRRLYWILFVALLVTAAGWLLLHIVFPTPPLNIPVGVGFKGGTYEIFFARYKEVLARHHVTLEYRTTGGAVANQNLLDDPNSDIEIGFVQGGVKNSKDSPNVLSLGRIAYQPFYIFYRADQSIDDLTQLKGKRIAIGGPGNGSAVAATKILAAAGVTAENSTFLPQFSKAAVDALIDDKADAMFEAFSNEQVVKAALRDPRIRMMSVRGAEALTRLFPFLSKITLAQGVVDYESNIPSADITLISTTVGVLVRKDLHPAIVTLMADAMKRTHGEPGLFDRAGEFPTQSDPEFPMAPEALDYYRNGPSFLNRYVPFWITNSAQRMAAVLVAIFGIILPLARLLPHIRDWFVRRRFQNWYGELQALEVAGKLAPDDPRRAEIKAELQRIEDAICSEKIPSDFIAQRFSLRGHIDLVRRKIGGSI